MQIISSLLLMKTPFSHTVHLNFEVPLSFQHILKAGIYICSWIAEISKPVEMLLILKTFKEKEIKKKRKEKRRNERGNRKRKEIRKGKYKFLEQEK